MKRKGARRPSKGSTLGLLYPISAPLNIGDTDLFNVPTMALLSEGPHAAAAGVAGGVKHLFRNPEQQYNALREGIEGGVVAPFRDRQNAIVDLLGRTPTIARAGVGAVGGGAAGADAAQQHDQNPLLGGAIGALTGAALGIRAPAISRGTNDLTWAIDDAAKQFVYKKKLARGLTPTQAAAQTLREMVDYRHRSQFTQALGLVAPFATFRSKMPAAIGSSVARAPQRALALDRVTQGIAGSGSAGITGPDGKQHRLTLTTPFSDAVSLASDPKDYARATMADPLKALLSPIALETVGKDGRPRLQSHYFTYGQPLLPHKGKDGNWKSGFLGGRVAGYAPLSIGEAALDATNTNDFGGQDWLSALLGAPLGVYVR